MDKKDISRLLISFLYDISPGIVNVSSVDNYFVCVYNNVEGRVIDSKVRFTEKGIEWGNLNGRWRNDKSDSKISYKVYGNKVKFTEQFVTGGKLVKELIL